MAALGGIAFGLGAVWLLLSDPTPWWLLLGLSVLLVMVTIWQIPRIQVRLFVDKSLPIEKSTGSAWRYWLLRLVGFLLVMVLLTAGQSLWWVFNKQLPGAYAWKKITWELGFASLPTFVTIPAGSFRMGSEKHSSEQPVHRVKVFNPFQLSVYEITFEQYDYFIWSKQQSDLAENQNNKSDQTNPVVTLTYPDDRGWGRGERPVINVSWDDAQSYVNWLSAQLQQSCRLPTEAEWEYAARAGTTTTYPWGDEASHEYANYGEDDCCGGLGKDRDQWVNIAPVGQFPANKFGLHDMHGNVWEWTQDCWHDDYKEAPTDGSAWETDCTNDRRVVRGGSWSSAPNGVRSAYRFFGPDVRNVNVGFRVLCAPPSEH